MSDFQLWALWFYIFLSYAIVFIIVWRGRNEAEPEQKGVLLLSFVFAPAYLPLGITFFAAFAFTLFFQVGLKMVADFISLSKFLNRIGEKVFPYTEAMKREIEENRRRHQAYLDWINSTQSSVQIQEEL